MDHKISSDVESAFQWKTIFTELASRRISSLDLFLLSTNAGPQFQREVENLMEAYLEKATAEERRSFEKAALEQCAKKDESEVTYLWCRLHRWSLIQEEGSKDEFWKSIAIYPAAIRGIANFLSIDSDVAIDKLRALVSDGVQKFWEGEGHVIGFVESLKKLKIFVANQT